MSQKGKGTGRKHSAETLAKMSKAQSGENNPMFGRCGEEHHRFGIKRTPEERALISQRTREAMQDPLVRERLKKKRRPMSKSTRKMLSQIRRGVKKSDAHKAKISAALSGEKNPMFGKEVPDDVRQKISGALQGRVFSEETYRKISESLTGPNHPSWKGGVESPEYRQRHIVQWKHVRAQCFERDDFTCQCTGCEYCGPNPCKRRGGKLNADHIQRWSDYPELRFELSNLRTLCVECHRKTPTYGRRRPKGRKYD